MIHSFYTSAAGMTALQNGLGVNANNIANVSTTGYKAEEPVFADLISSSIHSANEDGLKVGNGSRLSHTNTVHAVGAQTETGRALDFALTDSQTFFAVEGGNGIRYTRCGNFQASEQNGVRYLTSADGGYVLDSQGKRMVITNENEVNPGVFSFDNVDGLEREGGTYFLANPISGAPSVVDNPGIKTKCLEESTVDLTEEITQVIQLQRTFQMNSKMVQISDELMQTLNNMRG